MFVRSILVIAQLLNNLRDLRRRQVLIVTISDLHRRRSPARAYTLSQVPAEFAIPCYFFAELYLRSSFPAMMFRLLNVAIASATSPPSTNFEYAEKIGKQGPRA